VERSLGALPLQISSTWNHLSDIGEPSRSAGDFLPTTIHHRRVQPPRNRADTPQGRITRDGPEWWHPTCSDRWQFTQHCRRLAMKKSKIDYQSDDSVIAVGLDAAQSAAGRLKEESEHVSRLATLGTLAAGIAHEINNILTPVLAFAQMARAKPDDHSLQAKAIEKTIQGVQLATRIADAILGFSSTSDDREADVAQVVQAALDCLGRDPNKDRITVAVDVQAGTIVRMGFLGLQQVLMNLFLNAVTAMHGRGGRLTIAALTRADGTVGIRVGDTGPGIAKEIAGRIFEPFVTTKRPNEKDAGPSGSGLGLAICRRLIEDAGGTITATSKPGNGTTFHIILPRGTIQRAKAS
jgi:signal transduction histidine kinase